MPAAVANMTPKQAMRKVTKEFADDDGMTPYEINNGNCDAWAENVKDLLPAHRVEIWETLFGFSDTTHVFLRIDGKFYDAEAPKGVDDHNDLPIFAKLFAKTKRRQPVWLVDHNMGDGFKGENKRDTTPEMIIAYNEENGTDNDPY